MAEQPACHASESLDLSGAPHDVIMALLGHMDIQQRFTCALVCSDWAKAAAAATNTIVKHDLYDFTHLQQWLDKHGSHVGTLQLWDFCTLARMPYAQLQDLLLYGVSPMDLLLVYDVSPSNKLILGSRVWSDIAAATKLTSVQFNAVSTTAQQADVVSALTALPDLEQLTWREVVCGQEAELSDSRLVQQLTRLASLELQDVAAEALQHLSSLTKPQRLSMHSPDACAEAHYPGLHELKGLTALELICNLWPHKQQRFPACVTDLTALQQLGVMWATFTELTALTVLTALTKLDVTRYSPSSTPGVEPQRLLFPTLQQLYLDGSLDGDDDDDPSKALLHLTHLASCTQLRRLVLSCFRLTGPGSLVGSSMLQRLHLLDCSLSSNGVYTAGSPWELLFPGPGRLPHLTALVLDNVSTEMQQDGVERMVKCCSGLQRLELGSNDAYKQAPMGMLAALVPLSHLTELHLGYSVTDKECDFLAQLTELRQLRISDASHVYIDGLRHLASLEQLTGLGFVFDSYDEDTNSMMQAHLSDTLGNCRYGLVNKAPAGSPSDVSARLLHASDII